MACQEKLSTKSEYKFILATSPKKNIIYIYIQMLASTHTRHPYRQCICIIYTCTWYVCSQQNTPTLPHKVT